MTIKALQVDHFEGHKDTLIEFHQKFTVIIGTSDKGKSSIIRAIRWAIENQPNSDWLSWFADRGQEYSSALQFDDDSYVMRMKKGVENTYVCSDDENDPLHGFRKDVPDRVQKITRMDERNIKSQHDPYFMFQDSSGNVARRLNKIVGNDDINKFFKRVDSIIDKSQREMNRLEKEITDNQTEVESLKWIDKALKRIQRIDDLNLKLDAVRTKRRQIANIISELQDLKSIKKECTEFLEIKPNVDKLFELINLKAAVTEKRERIESIINKLKNDIAYKKAAHKFIKIVNPQYLIIKNLFDELNETREQRKVIETIVSDIKESKTLVLSAAKTLSESNIKYNTLLKSAKRCPTCGQSTKNL